MLKTSLSTAAVMTSIATQEVIDIAKGHVKWTYDVDYDILMRQAIDDDRAKKHTSKGTKTNAQLNKAERLANSAHQDGGGRGGRHGGRGRGDRGGRGGRQGRGGRHGRGGNENTKTFVEHEIWKQLPPEAQAIIRNSTARKTSAQMLRMNATQLTYGAVNLPQALWSQLPPAAQAAITSHNASLTVPSTQVHQHQLAHHQFQPQPGSVAGPHSSSPPTYQQVNAHGQTSAATHPPAQQPATQTGQHPTQPFLHQMMSTATVPPTEQREVLFMNDHTYYQIEAVKTHYK